MKINLHPQRADASYSIAVEGDVLILNGDEFDFSPIEEGDILPASAVPCPYIVGEVTRVGGDIELALIVPHAEDASEARRFPSPLTVYSGLVELPE